MKKATRQKKKLNRALALRQADEHVRIADEFIKTIPVDTQKAVADFAGANIPKVAATATNLSFALELYLKALRDVAGLSVPQDHNLWALYKSLPTDIKHVIEQRYDAGNHPTKPGYVSLKLFVRIGRSPAGDNIPPTPPERRQFDLKSVLVRNRDAFREWRYLFEVGKPGEWDFISIDLEPLRLACRIMRTVTIELHTQVTAKTTKIEGSDEIGRIE